MSEPNPIEEVLGKIEVGIRQLKTQYDMFFAGAAPRQPHELRKELETLLKVVGDTRMQRFADRYRFNSLATKYQSMVELWNKMIRAKEEGRLRPGIPGFVDPVRRPSAPPAAPPPVAARAMAADRFVIGSEAGQDPSLKLFYDRFLEANRGKGGDAARPVSFEQFSRQIRTRTDSIKQKSGCEAVTYSIEIKDNGVTLKAAPTRKRAPSGGKGGESK